MTIDLYISNQSPQQHSLWMEEISREDFNEVAPLVPPERIAAEATPRPADVVDGLEEIGNDALISRIPFYSLSQRQAD